MPIRKSSNHVRSGEHERTRLRHDFEHIESGGASFVVLDDPAEAFMADNRLVLSQRLFGFWPVASLWGDKPLNAEALNSLHEVGDDLIALHCLDAPNTLHKNLLSTNAIENSFRNTRRKLGRVTRFRVETDQATRWLAFALLEVEKGFHRISGYGDLPALLAALKTPPKSRPKNSLRDSESIHPDAER